MFLSFNSSVKINLIMRFYIMYFWSEAWDSLWLLHDSFGLNNIVGFLLNLLGSLPLIFIVVWSTSNMDILTSFSIALLRIPKLLRFREIWQMSKTYLKSGKEEFRGYFRVFRAIFSLVINTHIIGWIWLVRHIELFLIFFYNSPLFLWLWSAFCWIRFPNNLLYSNFRKLKNIFIKNYILWKTNLAFSKKPAKVIRACWILKINFKRKGIFS